MVAKPDAAITSRWQSLPARSKRHQLSDSQAELIAQRGTKHATEPNLGDYMS